MSPGVSLWFLSVVIEWFHWAQRIFCYNSYLVFNIVWPRDLHLDIWNALKTSVSTGKCLRSNYLGVMMVKGCMEPISYFLFFSLASEQTKLYQKGRYVKLSNSHSWLSSNIISIQPYYILTTILNSLCGESVQCNQVFKFQTLLRIKKILQRVEKTSKFSNLCLGDRKSWQPHAP